MFSILFCCTISFVLLSAKGSELSETNFNPGNPLTAEEFLFSATYNGFEEENSPDDSKDLEDDIIGLYLRNPFLIQHYLWPDGVVPYLLDEKYDEQGRILIARAFQELQNKTCVRFVPRVNQKDYVMIMYDKGCASSVGRAGGPQTVILGRGCYSLGIMLHELMHTLGFIHEQSREDRDKHVTIMWENIKKGREKNFQIFAWYTNEILKQRYDYNSILHYNRFAFSKDVKNKPTIVPKTNVVIGQRRILSEGDIDKINRTYKCKENATINL